MRSTNIGSEPDYFYTIFDRQLKLLGSQMSGEITAEQPRDFIFFT